MLLEHIRLHVWIVYALISASTLMRYIYPSYIYLNAIRINIASVRMRNTLSKIDSLHVKVHHGIAFQKYLLNCPYIYISSTVV